MSLSQRLRVKSEIANLTRHISYYELTEVLLHQLRIVSPSIFDEIENIKDKRGRPTDIYVRLIPKEKARIPLEAASFFEQATFDEDASHSAFGPYSATVDIWISNNALLLLSHELGHIKYVIPNLATYAKFYNKHYTKAKANMTRIGHFPFDQSGKYASAFEKRFLEDKGRYLKNGGKKPDVFFPLLARIRKGIKNSDCQHLASVMASIHHF